MEFYSRVNKPETIPAPSGEKVVPTFSLRISKETGRQELVQSGTTDIYEKIQASKESTLIYNIIERFQNGDISALNQHNGYYGDMTTIPTTLAGMKQALIDAENHFNQLPLEVRKEFNHNVNEYLNAFDNGTIDERLAKFGAKQEKTEVETTTTATTTTTEVKEETY